MPNLYELMDEYARLCDAAYATEDGGPDHAEIERILAELDESRGALNDKVDKICMVLRNLGSDVDTLEAERERLQKRAASIGSAKERLREWVRSSMEAMGVDKIKTARHTVFLSNGRPMVMVRDPRIVPPIFVRTTVAVDKSAVLANYKETGEAPPGIDIVDGKRRLTIR